MNFAIELNCMIINWDSLDSGGKMTTILTKIIQNYQFSFTGTKCRVMVLGYQSSGKTSLIRHFGRCAEDQCESNYDDDKTHDNIHPNAISENNRNRSQGGSVKSHCPKNSNQPLLIIKFKERTSLENFHSTSPNSSFHPDAYIIVYAVDSR